MRFCVAANLCCVDMTTEAFQRSRAIQTNNESLPSVLAIRNSTLSVAIISILARRFTHSTNSTLRRLNRGNDQRSPKQQARRIHRSDSPGIPLVQRAVGTFVAMIDDPVGGTERNY